MFLPPYGLNGRKAYGKETNPCDSPRYKILPHTIANVKCFFKKYFYTLLIILINMRPEIFSALGKGRICVFLIIYLDFRFRFVYN